MLVSTCPFGTLTRHILVSGKKHCSVLSCATELQHASAVVAVALEVGHGDGLDFRHRTSWRERWRILGVRFGVAMRNLREPGIDGRCDISRRLERANNGPGDNTAKLFYRDLGRHKVVVVNLIKLL